MRQPFALVVGLVVGVVLSGILVAALMVTLPDAWRTERVAWLSSLALVGMSVLAAFALSRPGRN